MRALARKVFDVLELDVTRRNGHRGLSLVSDLRRLLTWPTVFIDAGANVGSFSLMLADEWPSATIVSFEPIPSTFDRLRSAVAHKRKITPVNKALGDASGTVQMAVYEQSVWSKVVESAGPNTQPVEVTTIDEFCSAMPRLSLLKTDCEGYDNKVIRGADRMLSDGRIDAVYCEVNFMRDGAHGDFFDLHEFLTERSYLFYALYDYSFPKPDFTNALWIRKPYGIDP